MLFEPTNIIPSTLTRTGTVAQSDSATVQWQVNGNSAMTAYQIDIEENTTDSASVFSTGVIALSTPYYGKDKSGNYLPYTHNANSSWNNLGLSNGNDYKLTITQFYKDGNTSTYSRSINVSLGTYTQFYFTITVNGTTYYVSFTAEITLAFISYDDGYDGGTVYYNYNDMSGWIVDVSGNAIMNVTFTRSTTAPASTYQNIGTASLLTSSDTFYQQNYVIQSTPVAFSCAATPTLLINGKSTGLNGTPITVASYDFTATYTQAQDEAIQSVQWQLYNNADLTTPLADTGEVNTPVLAFSYNAFQDGETYRLYCAVKTSGDVEVSDYAIIDVSYSVADYEGTFTANCVAGEDCYLLSWEDGSAVEGVSVSSDEYTIEDGTLTIEDGNNVHWTNMSVATEWTFIWNGQIPTDVYSLVGRGTLGTGIRQIVISPAGGLLVAVGSYGSTTIIGKVYSYDTSSGTITYLSDLTLRTAATYSTEGRCVAFNSSGTVLAIGGSSMNDSYEAFAYLYTVSGTTITYANSITDFSDTFGYINHITISALGWLALSGCTTSDLIHDVINLYSLSGTTVTRDTTSSISRITSKNSSTTVLDDNALQFNPTGNILAKASFSSVQFYTVTSSAVTYTNFSNRTRDMPLNAVAFSPDGNYCVIGNRLYAISTSGSTSTVDVSSYTTLSTETTALPAINSDNIAIQVGNLSVLVTSPVLAVYSYCMATYTSSGNYITRSTEPFNAYDYPSAIAASADGGTLIVLSKYGTAYLFKTADTYDMDICVVRNDSTYMTISKSGVDLTVKSGSTTLATLQNVLSGSTTITVASDVVIMLNSAKASIQTYLETLPNQTSTPTSSQTSADVSYTQGTATAIYAYGPTVCNYIALISGDGSTLDFSSDNTVTPTFSKRTQFAGIYSYVRESDGILFVRYVYPNGNRAGVWGDESGWSADYYKTIYVMEDTAVSEYAYTRFSRNFTYQGTTTDESVANNIILAGTYVATSLGSLSPEGDNMTIALPFYCVASDYEVEFIANFTDINGLNGATPSTYNGSSVYRIDSSDGTAYRKIATLPAGVTQMRDYGIKSGVSYSYEFYTLNTDGSYVSSATSENSLCRRFQRYTLLATNYNETDGCYHVVKEYAFSCNVSDMSVSNNNSPSFEQNFTPYPTRLASTANYASGTLQALIGYVDQTANKYYDTAALMDELSALSTSDYTLFLKDMKGHIYMVATGGAISQTATQKTREMQVTISLPWTQIGSAEECSIIQTPEDAGWNNGAQILDVTLDVDVTTGLLSVKYPYPYNGTAFYLVAVTPDGVATTVNALPTTASLTTDGILTATVKTGTNNN